MNLCCKCQDNSQINVSMFGLENAGKTQLLYQWCIHKFVETTPTIAFNVETIQSEEVSVAIWDIGGQPKSRQFWRYYLQSVSAIFFVIDSTQRDFKLIQEAKSELSSLLDNKIVAKVPFLILFNKSDLNNSFTDEELLDEFGLSLDQEQITTKFTHQVKVMRTSAFSQNEIGDILNWVTQISQKKKLK
ncbi:ADP-ribosylation_factor 1 [Hexamita inflata]|uniref:ADP-ribosylation factor 1 n=1 Tax=Hexamita inflata TaxID=28002 RepID=A0AA86NRY3_9EUKA|nr:ADP-ribosylation factor 1 [Hexamita inflata]